MNNISLTVTTNFLNHYSLALSLKLKNYFDNYHIVVKDDTPEDRKKLGFENYSNLDFVVKEKDNPELVSKLFKESDVVITDLNYSRYANARVKRNQLTFVDSERIFKSTNPIGTLLRYVYYWYCYHNYKKVNLLCISAYAAHDYNQIGLFKDRTYKWGYFSEAIDYDINNLINSKKKNSLLWAGRLIEWKHPDYAIEVAKALKEKGIDFEMNIIGNGEMEESLKNMINSHDLNNEVHMLGSMSPENVRKYMEQSEIYLFTSDRGEGWGVVLNEAMNSGCVCISSYSAGSTPFLVKDNENGFIYKNDDLNELIDKTVSVINDNKRIIEENAYYTVKKEWNPETAANRFYEFCNALLENEKCLDKYEDGVLSRAIRIK